MAEHLEEFVAFFEAWFNTLSETDKTKLAGNRISKEQRKARAYQLWTYLVEGSSEYAQRPQFDVFMQQLYEHS